MRVWHSSGLSGTEKTIPALQLHFSTLYCRRNQGRYSETQRHVSSFTERALGFTRLLGVYVGMLGLMYFGTLAFDSDTVQPNLQALTH